MKVAEPYQAWAVDSQKACETEFPSFPSGRAEPARARPHWTFQFTYARTGSFEIPDKSVEDVQRTEASRFAQGQIEHHRRLGHVTDLIGANVWHGALPARLVSAGLLKGEGK
jgi:hypothetical protein